MGLWCHAGPGTPEKVEVVRQRAKKGQCLWHPDDAKLPEAYVSEGDTLSEVGENTTDEDYEDRGDESLWAKLRRMFRPR